jgi:hypothetical protein
MKSLIPARTLGHGLMLISAAFLLHATNGLAAEFVGDAQMQAGDLLSGTSGGRPKIIESRTIPEDSNATSRLDPQEQARQFILGKPKLGVVTGRKLGAVTGRTIDHRADEDAQELARRMILGHGATHG